MTDTDRRDAEGSAPTNEVKVAKRRKRRVLRLYRLYGPLALFAAAVLLAIVGLAMAFLAGAALPLGAAGLATVAAVFAALEGRDRTAKIEGQGSPVARVWIAVFAIVVVAGEGSRMAADYMDLQRLRICGQVEVSYARQLAPLPPGQSRHFTCSLAALRAP